MSESLLIWRLTDGKPGHMQQTLGLVRALSALSSCEVLDIDVAATPVGAIDFLLGRFTPGLAKKRPDLILGAGHATHFALLAARRAAGGRAVVLMKPSLPLFLFDLAIVPEHDDVPSHAKVIHSRGVLNPMHAGENKPDSLLLLIGGPSKNVQWSDAAVLQQIEGVVAAIKPGATWRITDSRRTPESLRAQLKIKYGERLQPFSDCPPGWLAERLAVTETVWVSEDSVSMVYEALTAGCRVGLLRLPEADHNNRVMRGVDKLVSYGLVTTFNDWSHTHELKAPARFNEAERVARLVMERLC